MRELRATDNDGYTVFQIEDLVRNMISIGKNPIYLKGQGWFEVQIFKGQV